LLQCDHFARYCAFLIPPHCTPIPTSTIHLPPPLDGFSLEPLVVILVRPFAFFLGIQFFRTPPAPSFPVRITAPPPFTVVLISVFPDPWQPLLHRRRRIHCCDMPLHICHVSLAHGVSRTHSCFLPLLKSLGVLFSFARATRNRFRFIR